MDLKSIVDGILEHLVIATSLRLKVVLTQTPLSVRHTSSNYISLIDDTLVAFTKYSG